MHMFINIPKKNTSSYALNVKLTEIISEVLRTICKDNESVYHYYCMYNGKKYPEYETGH